MLRVGVAKVLEDLGVRVVAATDDSGAALAALRTHQAGLLIVGDHADPSPEFIRRAFAQFPDLRCVVMVAGVGPAGLRRLFDVGIHAMVSRSVDPTELGDVVQRVLAGERVVSPGLLPAVFGTTVPGPLPAGSPGDPDDPGAVPPFAAAPLTPKEREVLRLVSAGRTNAEIAAALFVSGATVKTHLAHIYEKLGVRGRYEALSRAVAWGLLG